MLAPQQVGAILGVLRDVFYLQLHEVTFEMNPDDVRPNYLKQLRQLGITRASMGVQSFQPELLQFMHRAHSRDEALASLEALHEAGFDSFTVDLIYGNPDQTVKQLLDDVETLLQFEPPHISAYSLTVEPNTRLGKQVELNRIVPAEDDTVAEQFNVLGQRLKENGIERYEVSSYSRPGAEAVHNSNYWTHQNYLGLGPGAHSFWWSPAHKGSPTRKGQLRRIGHASAAVKAFKREDRSENGNNGMGVEGTPLRWQNEADIKNYPQKTATEYLNKRQLVEERIMMGLRTREGISIAELEKRYGYRLNESQAKYLKQKEQEEKVIFDESIKLTEAGIIIADAIILDLLML